MLPSFPSIRERNLRTLYGDGGGFDDRSPKGSVDVKIRPLVDMINRHPDYVTLSSCSGRVALFDPTAGSTGISGADDHIDNHDDDYDDDDDKVRSDALSNGTVPDRSTNSSGKGRGGKWIFVTHDILPDLGTKIIHSLKQAGRERLIPTANSAVTAAETTTTTTTSTSTAETSNPPRLTITFKHEPPLLHIAASNLESGMRLLRAIKSAPQCAMRESGLVVTDKRVTVEIRTTSTMLTLPIVIRRRPYQSSVLCNEEEKATMDDVTLSPDEEYLMSLSEIANERMIHNEALLEGLFSVLQKELFGNNDKAAKETSDACETIHSASTTRSLGSDEISGNCENYCISLQFSLPPLNLWKTAVVVLPSNSTSGNFDSKEEIDLDVIAFGGQGVGPNIPKHINPVVSSIEDDVMEKQSIPVSTTCKRWNTVFRLRRQGGVWSKKWDIVPLLCTKHHDSVSNSDEESTDLVHTSAGIFRLTSSKEGMGHREGHTACVIPRFANYMRLDEETPPDAVILFGGRKSGGGQGMSPTNDLFFYINDLSLHSSLSSEENVSDNTVVNTPQTSIGGLFGRPSDVRGSPPEPRYGHTMILLPNKTSFWNDATPFAVVAGGTGISSGMEGTGESSLVCLNSIYILTCIVEVEPHDTKKPSCSHLMWNRIADMPSPRSFHASVIDGNYMFVFGGYAAADDPFSLSPSPSSWFTMPLDLGKEPTTITEASVNNNTFASITDKLPSRIGSSAASLALKEFNTLVLIVGGAKSSSTAFHNSDHNDEEGCDSPIILIAPNNHQRDCDSSLAGRKDFFRARFHLEHATEDDIDFGSCVHHCVVVLPQSHDDIASVIVVGGGVPCFSFGQSYARSCIINITRVKSNNSNATTTTTNITPLASEQHHSNHISTNLNSSSYTRKTPTHKNRNGIQKQQHVALNEQANVIYVKSCHAKAVKNELEQRGLLDKRYKMIPVPNDENNDEIVIAIPIIISIDGRSNSSSSNSSNTNNDDDGDDDNGNDVLLPMPFSQWVIRYGTEQVPYSSSFLGTMRNKSASIIS